MKGDELRVVDAFQRWLEGEGWTVIPEVQFCDVMATRGAGRLISQPAT